MGNGNLSPVVNGQDSDGAQLDQVISALEGDILPRNTSGVVASAAGNVGAPATPFGTGYFQGLQINGQPIAPPQLSGTAINSGAALADGYPAFLSALGDTVQVLGSSTPLSGVIDGAGFLLSVDLTSPTLTLAPSSNNACVINDALFTGNQASKTVGEFGYWITITTIGSAITALNGKVAAFQYVGEIFLATVDTSNNRLIPIYRGIAGTVQGTLTNGGVITLLHAAWIFLGNDMLTINPVYDYPTWSVTAPAGPTLNDHWWDTANLTWKTWNGAAWIISNEVFLGMAICNTSGCTGVEPEDFNIVWDGTIGFKEIYAATTNIAIKGPIVYSAAGYQVNISTDQNLIYSSATPSWVYIYGDKWGNLEAVTTPPRNNKKRKGYYLPGSYKRLIGIAYNYVSYLASSRLTSDGWFEESMSTPNILKNTSGLGSFNATLIFDNACLIADQNVIVFYHVPSSGSVSVTLTNVYSGVAILTVFTVRGISQVAVSVLESGVVGFNYSTGDTSNNLTLYLQRAKIAL